MKIYIVQGQTGESADFQTWDAKAFKDQKGAQRLCDQLNQTVDENWDHKDRYSGEKRDRLEALLKDAGDPTPSVDYTSTKYSVFELELE